jgi:hypothetical protein
MRFKGPLPVQNQWIMHKIKRACLESVTPSLSSKQKARLLLWLTWREAEAAIRSLPAGSQDEKEPLSAQAVAHQKLANAAISVQGASLAWLSDDLTAP